ncbi:non-canonical purine NTP pyrophosphatase, RdgB/HAM1 family [Candidatus Beckwithbacteria bacterium RBG_13_42_9]|uniref:dITP/XTP pyrophosphatase n=1 Tax=Candidatus Beckwithbacteria bacterium RBG_13_42_9 TaxID=1797457 RepID=A0A1F5E5B9_9BACT|nr:MAG: non-canonical purine NTP pyrophosphatase, RdgB/HAM1 family [Candidatus Beckwithbacteria bacterium RBG_13_42_9]
MQKLLVATTSKGKLGEIKDILGDLSLKMLMPDEINLPADFKIEETGQTFAENACLKAKLYGEQSQLLTLADDSGLCVKALGGRPGLFTSRYVQGIDEDRWRKLLKELGGLPLVKRTAYFIAAVAIYDPQTKRLIFKEGRCRGRIAFKPKGTNGFGYDPIFIVDKLKKHFAQLNEKEKNQVSHRAVAIKKIKPWLIGWLEKRSEAKKDDS